MSSNVSEEWRPVVGYEGLYSVSSEGRVNSDAERVKSYRTTRLIKTPPNCRGYPQVTLRKNGIKKSRTVHRLVATAFLPNPLGLPQINHINGIKTDNRVCNLEWVTAKENIRHALRLPSRNESPRRKLTSSDVERIRTLLQGGHSARELATRFGVHDSHVRRIKRGVTWIEN
jgi:hypothetical protein